MSLAADNLDSLSGTAFDGLYDNQIRPELAKAMSLRPDQLIILTQSVGYPK